MRWTAEERREQRLAAIVGLALTRVVRDGVAVEEAVEEGLDAHAAGRFSDRTLRLDAEWMVEDVLDERGDELFAASEHPDRVVDGEDSR